LSRVRRSAALKRVDDGELSDVKSFQTPQNLLAGIDADATATLIAAASDIALIIDDDGTVCDVAFGSDELSSEGYRKWIGQLWIDTVTPESRQKVEALLEDAAVKASRKWRHVNHPSAGGADIPILYSAVQAGPRGPLIAFGRDLRSIGALQQRLVEAQQSMERDYWRLRNAETRYRLMFQMASDAVLIVDSATQKVVEANPAAAQLLGESSKRMVGRPFPEGFDEESTEALTALLANARASSRAEDVRARLVAAPDREFQVSASLVRQEGSSLFLLRLSLLNSVDSAPVPRAKSLLIRAVENAPDGFVVTDADGRILIANRAFAELAQLPSEDLARGELLDRWIGRPGVDMNILITNLKQHGAVRLYATTVRPDDSAPLEVEVSAVAVPHGEQPCLGFTIRHIGQRLAVVDSRPQQPAARSVEQLTELVGRVSLKDLVRESTDLIEKLCIEAALELTRDNRASAAEMLGLSRQSLYVKLRRYGLGDLSSDSDE
jgi:transcriptional regulator PpsR